MFIITPKDRRDAWGVLDNKELAAQLRSRESLIERARLSLDNTREELAIWCQELTGA